jgi:hypothetical protein
MMVVGGLLVGAVIGAAVAVRRKGARLDILQYAAGYAIFFAILALFLNIILVRMA